MSALHWNEGPAPASDPASSEPSPQMVRHAADPWFAATMGLLGLIIGYIIGS